MSTLGERSEQRIGKRLERLYGEGRRDELLERVRALTRRHRPTGEDDGGGENRWDASDAILITYGDMLRRPGERPLVTLRRFLDGHLRGLVSGVHVLPFFPSSSDDGFSVVDFRQVDPALGSWEDIRALGRDYRLMADLVLNHVSSRSDWFQAYCKGVSPGKDYFIEVDPQTDLRMVIRPRSLPLLTPVHTAGGQRHVWTTFSPDQIDLNYANPDVLLEMLDILLGYVDSGASIIRLDAVAFLWKRVGTPCMHLAETHEVVKLMRDLLEAVAPGVLLVSETNVPHVENVSYFGAGDEAHMVYQFSLPPLLLHALRRGDARYLCEWATRLEAPPADCTYFNFTASHDGIGLRPLEGVLAADELASLVEEVGQLGGVVSTRNRADGGTSPYELNITYFDALGRSREEPPEMHIARFLCSQTIMLALRGIPGIYFNSLIGARNDVAGMVATGRARSINRQKWDASTLERRLQQPCSHERTLFVEYLRRLRIRSACPAFHPDAPQQVLTLPDGLFGLQRLCPDSGRRLLTLHNLTPENRSIPQLPAPSRDRVWRDLIRNQPVEVNARHGLTLTPYQCLWLFEPAQAAS